VDLLAEHVTNKPVSADANLDVPAARAATEIQNQLLNQPQNQLQNQTLNVLSAHTNVKNVVERLAEHVTNKPPSACARRRTLAARAVTVPEKSEHLDTTNQPLNLLPELLNKIPLLSQLRNKILLRLLPELLNVRSALTKRQNVVDRLAELATAKPEIVNVSTDGPEVHVPVKTEKLPPLFTTLLHQNLEALLPQ